MRNHLLAVLGLLLVSAVPAHADKRVALVIGNSAYQRVGPLDNPANDANAMAETFKSAGFDLVEIRHNLAVNEMRKALRDFSDSARDADVAVVYYAGHGMEIDGTNYLVPVDAVLERDIDAFDQAVPLDRIMTVIEPARQLRLVILDACRDNPFANMKRAAGSRAIGRGLAKIDPGTANTLVAYAAKAGSTAADGDSGNSPFTAALIKHLVKPGLDVRKALGFTRDAVLKATNNRQEPFTYGSLGGDDVALVPALVPAPVAEAAPAGAGSPAMTDNSGIRRDYELAERVGTREAWDFFIANYPNGFYTKLAQAQRNKVSAEQERLLANEKAKTVQEEQNRLAAERIKAAERAAAAAQALAAEQARVNEELTKKIADARIVAQTTAEDEASAANRQRKDVVAFSAPPPPREALPRRSLLMEMGHRSRWAIGSNTNCHVPKTSYTLELNADSITWRNGIGSVDIESVVSSSENEFYTTTRTSAHAYGKDERTGQTWAYSRDGSRIRVQPGGRNSFALTRCS